VRYELKFATLLRNARLAALACGKASLRAGHGRKITFGRERMRIALKADGRPSAALTGQARQAPACAGAMAGVQG
jgi:hypothetical protein